MCSLAAEQTKLVMEPNASDFHTEKSYVMLENMARQSTRLGKLYEEWTRMHVFMAMNPSRNMFSRMQEAKLVLKCLKQGRFCEISDSDCGGY